MYITSYEVESNACQARLSTTSSTRVLSPRFLTYMVSYDVASDICQAVSGGEGVCQVLRELRRTGRRVGGVAQQTLLAASYDAI